MTADAVTTLAAADWYLVVDLEATCAEDGSIPPEAMEAIEVGACWVAASDFSVVARFQKFVKPAINPRLTPFCTTLTGIRQVDVEQAQDFPSIARELSAFVSLPRTDRACWLSWGAYDQKQLERDARRHGVLPPIALPHVNAKKVFANFQGIGKQVGLSKASELVGIDFGGCHHRALDDALQVARLLPWVCAKRHLGAWRPHST